VSPDQLLQPEPKRDRYGRYLLPDPGEPGATSTLAWTRATTFAKVISDTYHLQRWACRMVAKGVSMRQDLYLLAASAAADDKETLDKVAEAAQEAASSSRGANTGSALHSFTERLDRGEQVAAPPPWDQDLRAYHRTMHEAGITVLPEYIERIVVVKQYHVAGTFDRIVGLPDGRLVIADVKTQKDFYSWTEIGIQLALYAHADAVWNGITDEYEPMPEVDQNVALVMHVPAGKGECTLYEVDIATGWADTKLCTAVRQARSRKGQAKPLMPQPAAAPNGEHRRAAVERLGRASLLNSIKRAKSEDELVALWEKTDAAGSWTDEATEAARARKAQLTT
jgi:hypothetical protein